MLTIQKAVTILRQGGIVAMPTETVYGLAADAKNPEALRKIFLAKQRPIDHPLIVHIAEIKQLSAWAVDISEIAFLLAKTFWPGPLTLILKKAPQVSDLITGNQGTIGVRIPSHPVAQALLRQFGSGVAAPSANRFGRISPTTAQAVYEELGSAVDLILEGGACEVGVESTIVDVTTEEPIILRPGMITAKQIADTLHKSISAKQQTSPRVSGSLESHYAPSTKTRLMNTEDLMAFLQQNTMPIALLVRDKPANLNKNIFCIVMSNNPHQYAHDLYQTLRELDKKNFQQIVIENVPEEGDWEAIQDRLTRAAGK